MGGWVGLANRWVICGYVSYGCGNDNVVLKHYCYYLLNHLSNKKNNSERIRHWVSFYFLFIFLTPCETKTVFINDMLEKTFNIDKNICTKMTPKQTGFPFSQVTYIEMRVSP